MANIYDVQTSGSASVTRYQ